MRLKVLARRSAASSDAEMEAPVDGDAETNAADTAEVVGRAAM